MTAVNLNISLYALDQAEPRISGAGRRAKLASLRARVEAAGEAWTEPDLVTLVREIDSLRAAETAAIRCPTCGKPRD